MKKILLSFVALFFIGFSFSQVSFTVEEPASIQGGYDFTYAEGGGWTSIPDMTDPENAVVGYLVIVDDGSAGDSLGCGQLINEDKLSGAVSTMSIEDAGSGFTSMDNVTANGGSGTEVTVNVVASPEDQGVANFDMETFDSGSGYVSGENVGTTTAGGGTGLTVDIEANPTTLGVWTFDMTSLVQGSGYSPAAGVTTSSAVGTGLTVDIDANPEDAGVYLFDNASLVPGTGYVTAEGVATAGGTGENLTVDIEASAIGGVVDYTITAAGTDYVDSTEMSTTTNGAGSGLTVDITTTGGEVTNITINDPGAGYQVGDEVTIINGDTDDAVFTVDVVSNGEIISVAVNNSGIDYVIGDVIDIIQGDENASIEVMDVNDGQITSVAVNEPGEDYQVGTVISIDGTDGVDGEITVESVLDGQITSLTINEPGIDYAVGDVIMVDGGADQASIEIEEVFVGQIESVTVEFPGSGYEVGDIITIDGGDGGASFEVTATEGNFALVYRGECQFGTKALNAQNAGAKAVVIVNNIEGTDLINMAAGDDGGQVSIPLAFISQIDGAIIRDELDQGSNVSVFFGNKLGRYANDLAIFSSEMLRPDVFGQSQMLAQDGSEFSVELGGFVRNLGFNDQTNVRLRAIVELGGVEVYNEVSNGIDLASDGVEFIEVPPFSSNSYDIGYYDIRYEAESDVEEDDASDNEIETAFAITENTFSYSSLDREDLSLLSPTGIRAADADQFVGCIHFRNQNASRVAIEGLSFSAYLAADSEEIIEGTPFTITISRFINDFEDVDDPNYTTDLEEIGFYSHDYFAEEGEVVFAEIPESDGGPIILENNERYLACVETLNEDILLGYDRSLDYNLLFDLDPQPYFPVIVDQTFYLLGFGLNTVPAFGLTLMDAEKVSLEENEAISSIKVYPNPAKDRVNVKFNGNDVTSVEVMSMTGQVVRSQNVDLGQPATQVDVNGLDAGMYIFKVQMNNGTVQPINVVIGQ